MLRRIMSDLESQIFYGCSELFSCSAKLDAHCFRNESASAPSNHENEWIWYAELSYKVLLLWTLCALNSTVLFLLFFFSTFWRTLQPLLWCRVYTKKKGYVRSRNGIRYVELSQILKVKYIMVVQNFSPVKRNIASRVRSFFFYLC